MCKCLYTVTYKNLLLKSLLFLFSNTSCEADYSRNRIVIVNSTFLERPHKRSRRNQLIYMHLTKIKSIGSGQDPKSQVGRQSDGNGTCWWGSTFRLLLYTSVQGSYTSNFCFSESLFSSIPNSTYTTIPFYQYHFH